MIFVLCAPVVISILIFPTAIELCRGGDFIILSGMK